MPYQPFFASPTIANTSDGGNSYTSFFGFDVAPNPNVKAARAAQQTAFQNERQQLQQQQAAKGIKNPSALINLQAQLHNKQITPQQFTQQFAKAAGNAKGVAQAQPFKVTPGVVASSALQAGKDIATGKTPAIKAIAKPTVDVATGQGGKLAHDTAQLSSDVTGGLVNQFAKAAVNVPAALGREVQNKPITDIQKNVFGTTNQGTIAKKILASTAGTGSLFVGGGEAAGLTKAATSSSKVAGFVGKLLAATKATAPLGASGAVGNAAQTELNNPNATGKQLATSAAEGYGGAVALGGAAKGAGLVAKGIAKVGSQGRDVVNAGVGKAPAVSTIDKVNSLPTDRTSPPSTATPLKTPNSNLTPLSAADIAGKGSAKSTPVSAPVNNEINNTTSKGLGESGAVAPGQAVKDVQAMIDKHAQVTKASGDIAKGLDVNTGMQKDIKLDAASVLKNRIQLSPAEHQQIQDYRDAKTAGLTPQELPAHLQTENAHITALNAAAQKADAETARLSGNLQKAKAIEKRNPEAYTPRLARDKGTSIDYLLRGDRQNPLSVGGLSKTTSASKKRVMMAATDESGNRRVISIKTQTGKAATGQKFTKPNQVIAFSNGGKTKEVLGSIPSKVNMVGKSFVAKDGQKYTIGEAMQSEVTKHAGQKYYVDPKLAAVKNYADSRTALENTRFIEGTKSTLENKNLAVKEGETAPKGFKPSSNPYFRGYSFAPKVREVLDDAGYKSKDDLDLLNNTGRVLRQTIVYVPIKHDLNEGAFYAIDRGLSSLVNPAAYARMGISLGQAARDVIKQEGVYKQMLRSGSHMMTADDKQLGKIISKQLKATTSNPDKVARFAKAMGTSPAKMYKALQKVTVWDVQDILNVARVRERMLPTLVNHKGMSFEKALAKTERYNLQYKVPSRAMLPGKVGRSVSNTLRSPRVFFGSYTYDKYRVTKNIVKDTANLRHPVQAVQAADKLAAMVVGAAIAWPLVEKGVQNITGDKAAHVTAPGPLAIPQTVIKVAKGQQNPVTAAKGQISLGTPLTAGMDTLSGRNSFTGKLFRDPNAPLATQAKQTGQYLESLLAPVQKATASKNATRNKTLSTVLSMTGASLPKNTPEATKLYSLQYDSLPMITAQAKAQAQKGDFKGAAQTIANYDKAVMAAAQADAKSKGVAVPSAEALKKANIFYQPKQSTIQSWLKPKKAKAGAYTP